MRTLRVPAIAVLAACLLGPTAWMVAQNRDTFPHARHQGLFPECTGCHVGIPSGDAATVYPSPTVCASCHDGQVQRRVDYAPRAAPRPSNLVFSHPRHLDGAAGAAVRSASSDPRTACTVCHQSAGTSIPMAVGPPRPEACLACHAHEAPSHLAAGRDCRVCHVPVTRATSLSAAAVKDFPRPDWHDSPSFPTAHGPTPERAVATCAVCHARQSCTLCHMNAEDEPAILALAPDPRFDTLLAGVPPTYPKPATHEASTWRWGHGAQARDGAATCANCHARTSCTVCHRPDLAALSALPDIPRDDPRGVHLAQTPEVHPAGFQRNHGSEAADGGGTCAACHAQDFCTECHAGPTTPRFHEADFVERHGPDAYGSQVECVSCHTPEVFCRACHDQVGLTSRGRLDVAFHTANPFWLTGHGEAARRGLQGCVTCHSESDCVQCHAAVGGWGINPHGADFDPSRAGELGRFSCLPCHRGRVPGGGS